MNMEIKRATLENAQEIILAKADAFKDEVKLYGHGPTENSPLEREEERIRENNTYILLEDNGIIGGFCVEDKGQGHYHLKYIYVRLEYQNKGIGGRIMKFLEEQFPMAVKWTLETPYLSYRNHHFYEKYGFVKVGETEPNLELKGFYLFLYEKCS